MICDGVIGWKHDYKPQADIQKTQTAFTLAYGHNYINVVEWKSLKNGFKN